MEFREPMLVVAVGFMGVGKTYTTNKTIDDYIKNGPSGWRGRPVLAFDPNVEESYQDFKALDFDVTEKNEYKRAMQIAAIKAPGKYRILPYKKNRQPMTTTEMVTTAVTICKFYRNGMLILEDINKYTAYSYKQDMIGMLMGLRHLGVDLILHFQHLRFLPTRVWPNMTYLRWHKQSDPIAKFKDRVTNFDLYSIAEQIVNFKYQEDEHYYLWINNLKNKIEDVSYEDFKTGATNYLLKDPNMIYRIMREINNDGQKKYKTSNEAINGFVEEKAKEYLAQ
jgi:hypothetical protein